LIPFTGLDRVDGVGDAGVVAVESGPQGVVLRIYPLLTGNAGITVESIAPDGTATVLGSKGIPVTAGTVSQLPLRENVAGAWRRVTLEIVAPNRRLRTTCMVPTGNPLPYLLATAPGTPVATVVNELPRDDSQRPRRSFKYDAAPVPFPQISFPRPQWSPGKLRVLAFAAPANTAILLALARQF